MSLKPLVVSALVFVGCVTPAPVQRSTAHICTPDPSQGVLCIYRNQLLGSGQSVDLKVDGRTLTYLANDSYLEVRMPPGEHEVSVTGHFGNPSSLLITAAPGDVHFFRVEMEQVRQWTFPVLRERVGESAKRDIAADCSYAGTKQVGDRIAVWTPRR